MIETVYFLMETTQIRNPVSFDAHLKHEKPAIVIRETRMQFVCIMTCYLRICQFHARYAVGKKQKKRKTEEKERNSSSPRSRYSKRVEKICVARTLHYYGRISCMIIIKFITYMRIYILGRNTNLNYCI